ncbi:MAG: DUF6270 domain-containing protein [Propionibacteriaceae bacterium]
MTSALVNGPVTVNAVLDDQAVAIEEPSPVVRIAVMGSCITRDNFNSRFNPDYKQMYETVLMQNQSSVIALMSEGFALTDEELGEATAYDRWNVVTDLSKSFLTELAELQPDYLLVDFFGDVHFGVLDPGDGRWVTNNRWKLWATPYYQALKAAGPLRTLTLQRDTDAYLELWRESFDRFVAHVRRVAPDTEIIVHRGRNTSTLLRAGERTPVSLQQNSKLVKIDVPRYNQLWRELDDYAVASTGSASIDLTGREYPTMSDHPWGAYYVHYSMDYYEDFLTALNRIHLDRALPPAEAAMLRQVLRVTTERRQAVHAAQQRTIKGQRAKLKRQTQRIAQLEGGRAYRAARKVRKLLQHGRGR